ncbi:glycogen debranching N-terminal domain-containing protein, partial [Streptomyces sp. NPDC059627]
MHQPTPPSTATDNHRLRDGPPRPPSAEGSPAQPRGRPPRPVPARPVPPGPGGAGGLPPTHTVLICVALPSLAISTEHGQLTGQGLEGFYRAGRRLLARCQVRVAGREPLPVQARMT